MLATFGLCVVGDGNDDVGDELSRVVVGVRLLPDLVRIILAQDTAATFDASSCMADWLWVRSRPENSQIVVQVDVLQGQGAGASS